MMSMACGQAGMLISEFWSSTPREVANKIQGFYDLRESELKESWAVARAMTYNIAASMVGSDKIDFYRLSYFPVLENEKRPKLTDEQAQAIIRKMDSHMKNPGGKVLESNKAITQRVRS